MRRAFFTAVWSVVFACTAALAVSMTATLGAGDDPQARERAAREAGERWGVLTVFGSLGLAVVLYARIRPRPGGDRGVPLADIPDYPVLLSMMRDGGAPQ